LICCRQVDLLTAVDFCELTAHLRLLRGLLLQRVPGYATDQ